MRVGTTHFLGEDLFNIFFLNCAGDYWKNKFDRRIRQYSYLYNITEHTMDNKSNSEETCAIFGCDSPVYDKCPYCKKKVCASCVVKTLTHFGVEIRFNCSFCRGQTVYDRVKNFGGGKDSALKILFATAGIREQDVPSVKICECDAHTSYLTLAHVPCKSGCFRCRESIIRPYWFDISDDSSYD